MTSAGDAGSRCQLAAGGEVLFERGDAELRKLHVLGFGKARDSDGANDSSVCDEGESPAPRHVAELSVVRHRETLGPRTFADDERLVLLPCRRVGLVHGNVDRRQLAAVGSYEGHELAVVVDDGHRRTFVAPFEFALDGVENDDRVLVAQRWCVVKKTSSGWRHPTFGG